MINIITRTIDGSYIKNQFDKSSTLLNASKATNFIYKLVGMNDEIMQYVNGIFSRRKIIDRMNYLKEKNVTFAFQGVSNDNFAANLEIIDSRMAEILSYILLLRYQENIRECSAVLNRLTQENPMGYRSGNSYAYKYKKFLYAIALGMLPTVIWDGYDEANGGYIIVKNDGDILAFYMRGSNYFEDYLLNNTYIESPSTTRNGYASVYKQGTEYFMNLNLQIRFKA